MEARGMLSFATRAGLIVAVGLGLGALATVMSRSADHDALWKIVHDRCVPDQIGHHDPAPCALVDLTERWAVYKDDSGKTQFLLIPTDRVTGIEDPSILASNAPNYWKAAWAAGRFVQQRAPSTLSSDEISLAINAEGSRSQNQLHIHVDCIRNDVRDALRLMQAQVGTTWTRAMIAGQDYETRLVTMDDLNNQNLFALVASHLEPGQMMDRETMVLVGVTFPDGKSGFDLLVGRMGLGGNSGSGEALQDHGCAVAEAH
jgi:CDP-diacylglycerol pyrophosphatase